MKYPSPESCCTGSLWLRDCTDPEISKIITITPHEVEC